MEENFEIKEKIKLSIILIILNYLIIYESDRYNENATSWQIIMLVKKCLKKHYY